MVRRVSVALCVVALGCSIDFDRYRAVPPDGAVSALPDIPASTDAVAPADTPAAPVDRPVAPVDTPPARRGRVAAWLGGDASSVETRRGAKGGRDRFA